MSIDWSKYGVDTSNSGDAKTSVDFSKYGVKDAATPENGGASVDFSKYAEPKQTDFQQQEQKFGAPFQDPSQSQFMQQVNQDNSQQPAGPPAPPQSFASQAQSLNADDANGNRRTDYPGGFLNPLNDLNRLYNAPLLRELTHGAGQAMGLQDNQMSANKSTGSGLVDSVANVIGQGVGYMTNPSQLENSIGQTFFGNQTLQDMGNKVGSIVENKLPQNFLGRSVGNLAEQATNVGLGSVAYAPFNTLMTGGDLQDIPKNMLEQGLTGAALGGFGGALGSAAKSGLSALGEKYAGTKIGDMLNSFLNKSEPPQVPQEQGQLALPPASDATIAEYNRRNGNILPTNTEPIYGQGDIHTFALPEPSSYLQARYNNHLEATNDLNTVKNEISNLQNGYKQAIQDQYNYLKQSLSERGGVSQGSLIKDAQGNVIGRVGRISNNPKWYQDFYAENGKTPSNKELAILAKKHVDEGFQSEHGYIPSWKEQNGYDNTLSALQQVHNELQKSVDSFNPAIVGRASLPETKVKFLDSRGKNLSDTKNVTDTPKLSDMQKEVATSAIQPKQSDLKASTKSMQNNLPKDELKFAQTVKGAENTPPELKQALENNIMHGSKTSDKINHAEATKMIEKHGVEGMKNILLGLKRKPTPSEITAGNIIAQHYARLGGEANLKHSIDLVYKQGVEGRQLGQTIQAFSTWKKLDESGALMIATRNINKDLKDTKDWRSLTTQEAQPIKEAAAQYQKVEQTKSLADQVKSIIDNKNPNEPLTAAEKETFKQFQDQVKSLNEGVKQFLPKEKIAKEGKADATIKEVSQIEPKTRTRDQVVSFLDAKAEKARQRLAASRNIGFAAVNKGNPALDYAIIGAAKIAKGIVKLSDYSEAMIKDFGDAVKPYINESFNKATNIFRKENGLPTVQELDKVVNGAIKNGTFTEEQAHQFKAWANEIGHMSDEFKIEATQDLQKAMNAIGDSTLGQKLATIRVSDMLLSAPTALRNVIGNEAFNVLEKVNKMGAVPLDWALSKLTGERHLVFAKNQEKYWSNFVKGVKGGWKGVSPNGQLASFDIHPEVFKSDINPFKYMQKATGAMLQSFDHAAYMRAYGSVLGEYAKITGKSISELDQSIHDIADQAGLYATFQDETKLSKLAVGAKNLLNKPTDYLFNKAEEAGLPKNLSLRGFGAGDIVLAFAKTPANIIMRGIDYSPIGILRGLGELVPLLGKGEFNQRQAVLALSRGITGTLGMTGLGYILSSVGVLTGAQSSDKDIQQLDRMSGKGEYKVNWSALERYVTGGLDKNAAKWQTGDKIFDWGWLQPMAISLAMGINAQQSIAKQKITGTADFLTTAKDALIGSMNTMLQQPLLQGAQQFASGALNVAKYGSWSGIANIIKGIPASFVPSLANQARNFTDNTARNTYDPSKLRMALNMIINKIPGWDKQLPVAYDSLGNPKEQIQGGSAGTLAQGLQSFSSPVKPTTYTVSPQAKLVLDLIDATGNMQVAPRTPNSYVMVDKKKIPLTPEEYSQVQQQTGQLTQQMLTKITPLLNNSNIKDEVKAKEVISVLDRVGKKVRSDLERGNPSLESHALRR